MASAVFTSLCTALVTTAVQGNTLIHKGFNILIHMVSAGEFVAKAVEGRSEIYGAALVANGALAEREQTLKHILRLRTLEEQETTAGARPEPQKVKPAKHAKTTKRKANGASRPVNAASKEARPEA